MIPKCRNCTKCKVSKGLSRKVYFCNVKHERVKEKDRCNGFYPRVDSGRKL